MHWNSSQWNRVRIALILGVMLAVFGATQIVRSCSEAPDPFDDFTIHPDEPLEQYAAGKLGIVRPTFARSYLVVAYRYLSGVPLTKDEQLGAAAVWENRLGYYSSVFSGREPSKDNPYARAPREPNDIAGPWLGERKEIVGGDSPAIDPTKTSDNYANYVNCSADAFEIAAATLKDRAAKFGRTNPAVKDWVAAQDEVFANCSGSSHLPEPPDASLPPLLRYDREYQIAAAQMYGGEYEAAEKAFTAITGEKDSPWRDISEYLLARCMVRRAFDDAPEPPSPPNGTFPPTFDPGEMRQAENYAQERARDGKNNKYRQAFEKLLARIEYKLHPDQQQAGLAALLRRPGPDGMFYQRLWDYTWLLDDRPDTSQDPRFRAGDGEYENGKSTREADDLTDWIVNFQFSSRSSTEHAVAMWRAHRGSTSWLIAALSKTQPKDSYAGEVLAAADAIPATSPAYITAFYHRMRLRNGGVKYKDTRQAIDALLASKAEIPATSLGDLLDLRLDAASDLNDAVPFIARHTCSPEMMDQPAACPTMLAVHAASYLGTLPLDRIVEVVNHPSVPQDVRNQFLRNVWVRAVVLGRYDVALTLDEKYGASAHSWAASNPQDSPKLMQQYAAAGTPEEKQFAAIFLLQHEYAAGYEMNTQQPWCASAAAFSEDASPYGAAENQRPTTFGATAFLSEAERKQVADEQTKLDHLDSQANFFVGIVMAYAESHPDDPRVPEALSRAVANTRMNCSNPRTGTLSKQAFELLHKRYPNDPWAKRTKYWFE